MCRRKMSENGKIKIIIVDDHQMFREALQMLLNAEDDFEVIGEAGAMNEADLSGDADILLLDISMPKKNGIEAAKEITAEHPDLKIIFLTMHKNEEMIADAFEAGAKGYVLKENAFEELLTAIRNVYNGEMYVSRELSPMLLDGFLENKSNRDFSNREMEVLKMLAEGYSNKEISHMLCISVKTVETHRANIMKKHNFKNITELVLYAVRNNIIEV